jgi:hypothetical protein
VITAGGSREAIVNKLAELEASRQKPISEAAQKTANDFLTRVRSGLVAGVRDLLP